MGWEAPGLIGTVDDEPRRLNVMAPRLEYLNVAITDTDVIVAAKAGHSRGSLTRLLCPCNCLQNRGIVSPCTNLKSLLLTGIISY